MNALELANICQDYVALLVIISIADLTLIGSFLCLELF